MSKRIFHIILHLNIIGAVFANLQAQQLSLSIKAERPLSKNLVDSLQLSAFYPDRQAISQKVDTIALTLERMGYIESQLLQMHKDNDSSFTAYFHFGPKYRSIKVRFRPNEFDKKQLQRISPEVAEDFFILNFEDLPTAMRKLTALQNKKGNAFARLRLSEIEKNDQNELSATLIVESGNVRTVDSVIVKGYEKFPRAYLRHYAGIKKGKVFDQKKLLTQSDNLNSLGFVTATKPPEALFRKDSTIVYFYLEKRNNNLFDGILGFATDEKTQKLEFNGYLNLELNNNLNYGEQLLLNYRADGKEQIQFRAKVVLPYLLQSPFGVSGELKIFKRDSSFVTTEQELRTTYQISPTSQTYLGYRGFDSSNLLDQTLAGTPIENFKSKFFTAGASYLKPQNRRLFPVKTAFRLDLGIGKRTKEDVGESQFRAEAGMANIFYLNPRNSVFLQNTTHILFSDTYLVNELFRFGGIDSMRGFDENSIDASLFSVINTEYRYQFNETVFAHTIIDLGYFENQTLSLKQKLYSYGLGLGLNTQAGLFRFIVANGVSEDQDFDFSNTKIHISISSRF